MNEWIVHLHMYFVTIFSMQFLHCVDLSLGDPASTSTEIKWKEGMNLIAKHRAREQMSQNRKRKYGQSRTFFTWFNDNTDPSADDIAEVSFLHKATANEQCCQFPKTRFFMFINSKEFMLVDSVDLL